MSIPKLVLCFHTGDEGLAILSFQENPDDGVIALALELFLLERQAVNEGEAIRAALLSDHLEVLGHLLVRLHGINPLVLQGGPLLPHALDYAW